VKQCPVSEEFPPPFSTQILYLFVLFAAPVVSATAVAESRNADTPGGLGRQIYHKICGGCHGDRGHDAYHLFPPPSIDLVVTVADESDQIRAVLFGKQSVAADGIAYAVTMPPRTGQLSDGEI
jgi:mono/diheme cytochrome c family protein